MRVFGVAATSLLLLMVLAACSPSGAQTAGRPLPATPAATDSGLDSSNAGVFGTPSPSPAASLAEADTSGLESTPWELTAVTEQGLTIRYVAGGGCSASHGVHVEESAESVEIWTTVKTDTQTGGCSDELRVGATEIELRSPLGSRTLLHAPVSKKWSDLAHNF